MQRIIVTETDFASPQLDRTSNNIARFPVVLLDNLQSSLHSQDLHIKPAERWAVWEQAYALAQRWYRSAAGDPTIWRGISLGATIEIEMWYAWRGVLEDLAVLRRIVEVYAPTEVVLATYRSQRLARLLTALGVRQVRTLAPPITARLRHRLSRDQRTTLFKSYDVDRHVRLLALAARQRRLRPALPKQQPIDTLALLELPGSYYADTLLPVLAHLANSAILLMDPRHIPRAAQSRFPQLAFSAFLAPFLGDLVRDTFRWRTLFQEQRSTLRAAVQIDGIDLWPVVAERLARTFTLKFPLVAAEVRAAEALLQQHRVQSLLLVSDAHHGSRLLTLVGRKLGIPSVVVQHGATFAPWGYLPLHADRFAAWGESSRQWMLERGADPERVVVTGQPRFDTLANRSPVTRPALSLPQAGRLLLWIVDPFPIAENRAILTELAAVVAQLADVTLVIRPHPSMSDTEWLVAETQHQRAIHVSPAALNLHDVITCCDAVLIQGSTVGIEALALNRPVIVFPADPENVFHRHYDTPAVQHCATPAALLTALQHLFSQGAAEAALHNERQAFVRNALYQLDGQSAARVAALVAELELASPHPRLKRDVEHSL
jgi:diadenosine tetraphosphatase ApaH/serine/threonine PP2A family protein phosphatase